MKYLKLYNESSNEFWRDKYLHFQNAKDILLPIEDLGIKVSATTSDIKLHITCYSHVHFDFKDIVYDILHLISYLSDESHYNCFRLIINEFNPPLNREDLLDEKYDMSKDYESMLLRLNFDNIRRVRIYFMIEI